MNWRRLIFYLVLNAIVSASVTLGVLYAWDITHPIQTALPTPMPTAPSSAPVNTQAAINDPGGGGATATPTVYVVKGGDTLGSIAVEFDVTVEAIMQANGLDDPNSLSVGQSLVIPVEGTVLPTATPSELNPPATTVVTPPPTGTAASPDSAPQLAIRNIADAGSLSSERVTIVNLGGVVDLAGWSLVDVEGNTYTFPALTLFQGGAVTVHTALGNNTVIDLYWGQTAAMWQTGELATLKDPQGQVHTTFTTP
jgi:LysM repeat protein